MKNHLLFPPLLTALLLLVSPVSAWANCEYVTLDAPHRDGIAKSWCGRPIARIMGWQGASWLERASRPSEERTDLLLSKLKLKPGMVVGDIGAGSGFLSRQMAPRVQPGGTVWAVDIQPEMIDLLQKEAQQFEPGILKVSQSTSQHVNLPDNSLDLAIMVDVYHELEYPREVLQSLMKAVKPGGQIVFVEYRALDPDVPIKPLHTMSVEQVRREAEFMGLKYLETAGLSWQNMIRFENP